MRSEEKHVKAFLEAGWPDSEVHFNHVQSAGEYDFQWIHPSGVRERLEVTLATDPVLERLYQAVLGKGEGTMFLTRICAQADWYVSPKRTANIRRLRRGLDEALAAVEQSGKTEFHVELDGYSCSAVARIGDLGVESGRTLAWNPPGRIGIGLPVEGGWLGGENIVAVAEAEAAKSDNRLKLTDPSGAQSHLFVVADRHEYLARGALLRDMTPERSPRLSPEIGRIWVGSPCHDRLSFVAVTATSDGPWTWHGPIALPEWALDRTG